MLAIVHALGTHGVANDARALNWLQQSAGRGFALAQRALAIRYAEGRGVPKDSEQAVEWLRKAAENGFARAQYNLGNAYSNGHLVSKDPVQAVMWLRKAAEQGHGIAQYRLGRAYQTAYGVPGDKVEAVSWFRRAAEQGHPGAAFQLAGLLYLGSGVDKDQAQAFGWLRFAAERGIPEAQQLLGFAYERGDGGIAKDEAEAIRWYQMAALTYKPASEALIRIKGRAYVDKIQQSRTPQPVRDIDDAVSVAVGGLHTCALRMSGKVACWGSNVGGQLGSEFPASSSDPLNVTGITDAAAITAGPLHSCALLRDGTVECWGAVDEPGQLGIGLNKWKSPVPAKVLGISAASAISSGYEHMCAVIADGTVRCWGRNSQGQLGNGNSFDSPLPVRVRDISDVKSVTAGYWHSCSLLGDGTVKCWGTDSYMPFGKEDVLFSLRSPTPVTIEGIANAIAVAAGRNHTCALLSDGTVRCWGSNILAQLGGVVGISSAKPVPVVGISGAVAISAQGFRTCVVLGDGAVKCWGARQHEIPPSAQDGQQPIMYLDLHPTGTAGISSAAAVAVGASHSCAQLTDRAVTCWGQNHSDQLGRRNGD